MHSLLEIFQNEVLICALTSWFIAQVLKIPTYRIVEKEWNWRRFFGSGGMPSSHTSFVVALTLMIGFTSGFGSMVKVLGMEGIDWEAVIADTVPEKFRDMNIRAYRAGYGAV